MSTGEHEKMNNEKILLQPTVQTVVGMVTGGGRPVMRLLPNIDINEGLNSTHNEPLKFPAEILKYDEIVNHQVSPQMMDFFHRCIVERTFPICAQEEANNDDKDEDVNMTDTTQTSTSPTTATSSDAQITSKSTMQEVKNWVSSTLDDFFKPSSPAPAPRHYSPSIAVFDRLYGNIFACTQQHVSGVDLKRYMRSNKRIDIEQAVALAISALNNECNHAVNSYRQVVASLLHEVGPLAFDSCMWLSSERETTDGQTIHERKYERFIGKFNKQYQQYTQHTAIAGLAEMRLLIQMLRRIRHSRHPQKCKRCLRIPTQLYAFCNLQKPDEDKFDESKPTYSWPERTVQNDDSIVYIGRRRFNRLNQQLRCLLGKFNKAAVLRRKIWQLRDAMKCANMKAVQHTNDLLALCFSFIAFQRRSQLKIVSDAYSSSFLGQGQSAVWLQNTPQKLTTFEHVLIDAALQRKHCDIQALTAVVTPPQVFEHVKSNDEKDEKDVDGEADGEGEGANDGGDEGVQSKKLDIGWNWEQYARYIDSTALLMEEYVVLHGDGVFENLCFKRGVRGGARGPVDDYNLLCDVMATYVQRYKDSVAQFELNHAEQVQSVKNEKHGYDYLLRNLPDKNHKFLAKDIMHWNNAWQDDAFACGKRPDWLRWLSLRRKDGVIAPAQKQCT